MAHVTHLNKSGAGMASNTACGRNIMRSPLSTNWEGFKALGSNLRCAKCEASKTFEFLTRNDSKTTEAASEWVPMEDPNAWIKSDAELIARNLAKRQAKK